MNQVIKVLEILNASELNTSELLLLVQLREREGYLKIEQIIEQFKYNSRWVEDNVKRLHKKGYVAMSPMGNRYKLSKKGIQYTTSIFLKIHPVGKPYKTLL